MQFFPNEIAHATIPKSVLSECHNSVSFKLLSACQ